MEADADAADGGSDREPQLVEEELSLVQAQALQKFRSAFSHLENDDVTIAAWLTPRQWEALGAYRSAFGAAPKQHWALEELPVDTTDAEREQVGEFKARLEAEGKLVSKEDAAYASDLRLLQYLRAREHVLGKSFAMFLHTLDWRRTHKPWELENVTSRTNKTCSDERIMGFDRSGRIVVYSSFARTTVRTPKDVQINVTTMMEKASLCISAGSPGSLIWVNNFSARHKNGFGWRDCNPAFFFSGIDTFMNHYPECLKTMVIIDPPSIFFSTWAAVRALLAPKTQGKAEILDSRKESTRVRFVELFGKELGDHLMDQIKRDENA